MGFSFTRCPLVQVCLFALPGLVLVAMAAFPGTHCIARQTEQADSYTPSFLSGAGSPQTIQPAPQTTPPAFDLSPGSFEQPSSYPNSVPNPIPYPANAGTIGLNQPQSINTPLPAPSGNFAPPATVDEPVLGYLAEQAGELATGEDTGSSVKIALLLGVLSLAPALILMTTSYVRVVVVLTLLKQAFGGQQLPPAQVITALSLFITLLVMAPVWNEIRTEAVEPYTAESSQTDWQAAFDRGVIPVRRFMIQQIEAAGNSSTVAMFYRYSPDKAEQFPSSLHEVPLNVLLPSFMVSELKVAFLLGFQIYLPFLIIDLVVSSVTVSMGMMMLPPTMVSFPLKLILFVMVDGWALVVGMLMQSFAPYVAA